jgi:sensor histidine kinase regulating citrate/malate metabolism
MGLAALLCTLYAYRQLCKGFQAQAELQSLTQAAHEQKVYIAEAQARYEQTKFFRHDIKNHLSVLDGLLRSGKLEEGREYLKKLEAVSEALSFPYQTGNPVVDILLGEQLGLAKEIEAEVSLVLPKPCGIDDFDLCVLFANALDNAIAACRANDGAKAIRISGKQQGDFYMLTFENTCSDEPLPPAGTGLSNIKAVAEKYHGALLTEKNGRQYYLSVLLNISPCNS